MIITEEAEAQKLLPEAFGEVPGERSAFGRTDR